MAESSPTSYSAGINILLKDVEIFVGFRKIPYLCIIEKERIKYKISKLWHKTLKWATRFA